MSKTGPALERFAGLGYLFLIVSIIDPGTELMDAETELSDVWGEWAATIAGGVDPRAAMIGILLVGAITVLGLYFRKKWGLIGAIGVFGIHSLILFLRNEWTLAGVGVLCVLYLLSRADVVLDRESDAV